MSTKTFSVWIVLLILGLLAYLFFVLRNECKKMCAESWNDCAVCVVYYGFGG